MMEMRKRTERGCCDIVCEDGRRLVSYHDITSYDDWRETPIGRMNFGRVHMGPWRYVIEHPDGRQEPTTQELFIASEMAKDRREREKLKGFLERLARRIFG